MIYRQQNCSDCKERVDLEKEEIHVKQFCNPSALISSVLIVTLQDTWRLSYAYFVLPASTRYNNNYVTLKI